MKAAIIYASVHHENTKKVVEAIAGENVVDLIRIGLFQCSLFCAL